MNPGSRRSDSGMTVVEVVLGAALAIAVAGMATRTIGRMQDLQASNDFEARLQSQAHRAQAAIANDLRRALYQPLAGAELPYVFDDGVAEAPYDAHSHVPNQSAAIAGDPDFGPNREIVFLLPQDADGDGRPDLAAGALVWAPDEISYTVITDAGGNALVRSVNAAAPAVIARDFERIVFDTPESSGFTIPLGCVRVRLFLRARDKDGTLYRYQTETVIRLQPAAA